MNIEVLWDDEAKTAIRYVYKEAWDWNDYYAAINAADQLLDCVSYQVAAIHDFRSASMLPKGAITHMQKGFAAKRHRNLGMLVFVGANMFIQSIERVGRKLAPSMANKWDIRFARSLEEAREIARQYRRENKGEVG